MPTIYSEGYSAIWEMWVYKILAMHFKSRGKWRKKDIEAFLEEHRSVFSEAGITNQSLFGLIEKLRDKCAHIKTGSKKELLGVTHLNPKVLSEVLRILEPFKFLCASCLSSKADGFEIRLPTGPRVRFQGLVLEPGSHGTLSYN